MISELQGSGFELNSIDYIMPKYMQIQNPVFFIGYDSKEDIAYRVCKQSLLKNSSIDIKVLALKLYELIAKGYYKRSVDPLASTEFTYSRFLVPLIDGF